MNKVDILDREPFVEQLFELVKNISERKAKASFAIDGAWGCGKSFVLDMLEERLEPMQSEETADDKYLIARYNCWKYDYYEEPLIAIVSTLIDTINKKRDLLTGDSGEKFKAILKAAGATLLSISTNALSSITGVDIEEAYNFVKSSVDAGTAQYEKTKKYDVYFDFKKTLQSLQKVLGEISEQYTLVFLIDELDRCLPEYAIKVLERLHHLTEDTNNIINIIAIDKQQLLTSVCHTFGFVDANEYLKKFIQFTIPLDLGSPTEKIVEKFSKYVAVFDDKILPVKDSIEEFFQAVFMKIGAREQERLIERATMVHELLYKDVKDYSFMCVEILLVVLAFQYQGIKRFSQWFQEFSNVIEGGKKLPPFSNYFKDKFERIPSKEVSYVGARNERIYVFLSSDSLYGAIACIWHEMFLKDQKTSFTVEDEVIKRRLMGNAEELKKFSDTIKLIK